MIKIDFDPPKKQLRQFGWIALFGFALMGYLLRHTFGLGDTVFYVFVGLGVAMALSALLQLDAVIKPVYVLLMIVAFPIGMVISVTLLAAIFYGMFAPVGLVFRLFGRDPLNRRLDSAAKSYWRVRETQRPAASYLRLY